VAAATFVPIMHIAYTKKADDFNNLYLTTRDGLFHFLSRYSKDIHLLEDIMQQCYLKIWEQADKIKDLAEAGPLVRVYARNLMIDTVRRRMKEDMQWLEQLQNEVAVIVDSAISETGKKQLLQLDTAIEKLPETVRKVYLLHRETGLSYREIATQLSLSVSMVEKYMSKAISLLRHEVMADMGMVLAVVAGSELLKM
jgi:RNA polymerase sigma factor (sigma-70 family)